MQGSSSPACLPTQSFSKAPYPRHPTTSKQHSRTCHLRTSTAQRVCKFWRTTIAWSTHLQERMFIKASHYCHPIPRWHQRFNGSLVSIRQAPFVVNPIVERTWILPDPEDFRTDVDNFTLSPAGYEAKTVKCFGEFPRETPLAFRQRPYLTNSRMSQLNNVGLGQCGLDGWRIPGQLRDIEERDFFHPTQIYWNKSAPLSRSPNGVPTASWLNMLLTQPPVSCIGLKHPVMPTSWIVSKGCGVRIGHVLDVRPGWFPRYSKGTRPC